MRLANQMFADFVRSGAALLVLFGFALAATPVLAQSKPDIRISTARPGGAYYVVGAAIAEALHRSGRVRSATSESSSGSVENARLLQKGTVHIALMDGAWVGLARSGSKPFKKKIDLRTASPAYSAAIFFITLADSGIKKFDDLRGKRVAIGSKGTGMEQHSLRLLNTLGLGIKGIKPVYLGFRGGGAALREGRVDAQIQCCYPNSGLIELTQLKKTRVVQLSGSQRSKLFSKWPNIYSPFVIPKGAFKGVDVDVPGVSLRNGFITHANTDASVVYIFVKTLLEKREALRKKTPHYDALASFLDAARKQGRKALEINAPLHPGAVRAFKETGILK